jgi:hypothetical protein
MVTARTEGRLDDFTLISVPWFNPRVTTHDENGAELPDTGEYQRHGAEIVFVFAEFIKAKGLLNPGVDVTRRPDLELRFSHLTPVGQEFARSALHRWMQALDRAGPGKPVTDKGLERHWNKFTRPTA